MNIVLIGYRCSGKTVVGRAVAKRLDRAFVDADDILEEKAGRSIEKIVEEHGWVFFRQLEQEVIQDLSVLDNLVISTGGGVVINGENIRCLKQNGFLIWLRAGPDILSSRMNSDQEEGKKRPSLTGKDSVEELRTVLDQRIPLYQMASDGEINTDRLSVSETVERIIELIPPLKGIPYGRKYDR
jgi:shikimate kinase